MKKIFIDGKSGTTGLRIAERLAGRKDIEIITLSEEERKNPAAKKRATEESDVTFLCLPDDAARDAVSACENPDTVIIDASTAHRTEPGWLYGFPEIYKDFEARVRGAKRIAVPGCHACGFIALIKPLVDAGIVDKNAELCCTSVTGYSGGGKKMIAEYEDAARDPLLNFPRQYGLNQSHKHLKEMRAVTGLNNAPAFSPIVAPFYSGMCVTVPLFKKDITGGAADIEKVYSELYRGNIVRLKNLSENGFISAGALAGKDGMQVSVFGCEERILLAARYDNLGKGASGAAIECLNYVLSVNPETGLCL